jgi:hypothetical protein
MKSKNRLLSQKRIVDRTTVEDSVLRTEKGVLESQEEDVPKVYPLFVLPSWSDIFLHVYGCSDPSDSWLSQVGDRLTGRSSLYLYCSLGCHKCETNPYSHKCEYESRQRESHVDITCPSPPSVTVCPVRGTIPTVSTSSTGRDIVRNARTMFYTGAEQTSLLMCLLIHLIRFRRGPLLEIKKKCVVNVICLLHNVKKCVVNVIWRKDPIWKRFLH